MRGSFLKTRTNEYFVPVKLKLHNPPREYPGKLTVHRAQGGGNLNVALEGWGI